MQPAKRFEDLLVWQKSHALTLSTYRLTRALPKEEMYGLCSQMRKAAVSVSANIAEGFAKRGRPDKARLMNVAQGSLEELRYYFLLSRDLEYLAANKISSEIDEVGRMLGAYIRTLQSTPASNS